jgi:hypothetical protein
LHEQVLDLALLGELIIQLNLRGIIGVLRSLPKLRFLLRCVTQLGPLDEVRHELLVRNEL